MKARLERVPPAVFFFACLLMGWALGRVRPAPLGLQDVQTRLALGLSLVTLAAVLAIWALAGFSRSHTTPAPFGTPTSLLTSGPFRFSRNPLYVALVLALAGLSAVLDSAWVLASAPLLVVALNRFIIPGEEARLHEVFGERYVEYSGRVRRWL